MEHHPTTRNLLNINSSQKKKKKWKVPIILDLGAFAPDGSPHYVPPDAEKLSGFVNLLDEKGLTVIGLANIANCGGLAEEAACELGLPAVFGVRASVSGARSSATSTSSTCSTTTTGSSESTCSALSLSLAEVISIVAEKVVIEEREDAIKDKRDNIIATLSNGPARGRDSTTDADAENDAVRSRHDAIQNSTTCHSNATAMHLSKLSYRELQMICKASNLPAKGSTNNLVRRIQETDPNDIKMILHEGAIMSSASTPQQQQQREPVEVYKYTPPKIHKGHVRSGQQISAENSSLVVMGSVHSGGEVMADGDIYIYGKLRGRALAGLDRTRSSECRIFAQVFDPELVCIGGTFTTVDSVQDMGLRSQDYVIVSLDDGENELRFENANV